MHPVSWAEERAVSSKATACRVVHALIFFTGWSWIYILMDALLGNTKGLCQYPSRQLIPRHVGYELSPLNLLVILQNHSYIALRASPCMPSSPTASLLCMSAGTGAAGQEEGLSSTS